MSGWILSVDVGTSFTAAATASDGQRELLMFAGQPRIPSVVLVDDAGNVTVGTAAERQAALVPEQVERTPKRLLGAGRVLLGSTWVEPTDLIAALIRTVHEQAVAEADGTQPDEVRLTHPVRWGSARRDALMEAARRGGVASPLSLVAEPVAAAVHLAGVTGAQIADGNHVAVFDLGGGTLDTAVLTSDAGTLRIVAQGGAEDIGGEDVDDALIAHLGAVLAGFEPEAWEGIRDGSERRWRRAALELRLEVRRAKEELSDRPDALLYLPSLDRELRLTRDELEECARPRLERAADILRDTIAAAGVAPADLQALYLAGGASRMPLVASLLTERLGAVPSTRDDPKAIVALGATLADPTGPPETLQPAAPQPAVEPALSGAALASGSGVDTGPPTSPSAPESVPPIATSICARCGASVRSGLGFCTSCGASMSKVRDWDFKRSGSVAAAVVAVVAAPFLWNLVNTPGDPDDDRDPPESEASEIATADDRSEEPTADDRSEEPTSDDGSEDSTPEDTETTTSQVVYSEDGSIGTSVPSSWEYQSSRQGFQASPDVDGWVAESDADGWRVSAYTPGFSFNLAEFESAITIEDTEVWLSQLEVRPANCELGTRDRTGLLAGVMDGAVDIHDCDTGGSYEIGYLVVTTDPRYVVVYTAYYDDPASFDAAVEGLKDLTIEIPE